MYYLSVLLVIIIIILYLFIIMYRKYLFNKLEGSSIFEQANDNNKCLMAYLPWNMNWTFLRYNKSNDNNYTFIMSSLDTYFFKELGIMKTGTLTNPSKIICNNPKVGFCHWMFTNENNFNSFIYGNERDSHKSQSKDSSGNIKVGELLQPPLKGKNESYLSTYYACTTNPDICLTEINNGKYNIDGLFIQSLEGLIHNEDIAVGLNENKKVYVYGGAGFETKSTVTKNNYYAISGKNRWGHLFVEYEFHVIHLEENTPDTEFYTSSYINDLRDLAKVLSYPIIDNWIKQMPALQEKIKESTSWETLINGIQYNYTMTDGLFTDDTTKPIPLIANEQQGTISYENLLKNLKHDNLNKWIEALNTSNTYSLDLVEISIKPSEFKTRQANNLYEKLVKGTPPKGSNKSEYETYIKSIKKLPDELKPLPAQP